MLFTSDSKLINIAQTTLGKGSRSAATAGIKHFDVFQELGHKAVRFWLYRRRPRYPLRPMPRNTS